MEKTTPKSAWLSPRREILDYLRACARRRDLYIGVPAGEDESLAAGVAQTMALPC